MANLRDYRDLVVEELADQMEAMRAWAESAAQGAEDALAAGAVWRMIALEALSYTHTLTVDKQRLSDRLSGLREENRRLRALVAGGINRAA